MHTPKVCSAQKNGTGAEEDTHDSKRGARPKSRMQICQGTRGSIGPTATPMFHHAQNINNVADLIMKNSSVKEIFLTKESLRGIPKLKITSIQDSDLGPPGHVQSEFSAPENSQSPFAPAISVQSPSGAPPNNKSPFTPPKGPQSPQGCWSPGLDSNLSWGKENTVEESAEK